MSKDFLEITEKYLEEVRNLDAEYKAYNKLRIDAICERNKCFANRDLTGFNAWDAVKEYCINKCALIREDIKDRYYECIQLEAM